MSNTNDKLSKLFNVDNENDNSSAMEILPIQEKRHEIVSIKEVAEQDTEFARDNIKNLIHKGGVALDNLLAVARESEHPRAYEVAAAMIKNLSDSNKDLLNIQKTRRDLTKDEGDFVGNTKNMNIDKAVFVGSTTELIKFLNKKDDPSEDTIDVTPNKDK